MISLRLLLKFIFFLPGTFLHELTHYIAALVFGKAEGFSVWPRVEGDSFVFGSVKSRTKYKVLSSFIAAAPVLWWVAPVLILRHYRVLGIGSNLPATDCGEIVRKIGSLGPPDIFSLWLFLQILWAGKPSMQDIRNFFTGLFSVSGIILLSAAAGLIYIARHFTLTP